MFQDLLKPFTADNKGGLINSFHLYRMLNEAVADPEFMGAFPVEVPEPNDGPARPSSEWCPPRASVAERQMPLRNLRAFRVYDANPLTGRETFGESRGEQDLIDLLTIRHDIRDLFEQQEMNYVDDGMKRSHFIDVMVVRKDGFIEAYSYKDASVGTVDELRRVVELVFNQNRDKLGSFEVATRATVSKSAAANARVILRARRLRDDADVRRLRDALLPIAGWVDLPALACSFEEPSRAFDAAVNLIDNGALAWGGDDFLTPEMLVRPIRLSNQSA